MKIKDIMTPSPRTVEADASIKDAAYEMRAWNIGVLPVMDQGKLVGIVTDRDIVVRCLGSGDTSGRVRDAMTPDPACLPGDEEVSLASDLMRAKGVGRLLITDGSGQLRGIVTASDIAVAMAGDSRTNELAVDLAAAHRAS